MGEGVTAIGDRTAEGLGERETQSVAKERCMKGRMARRQGDRRSIVEDPTDREIFEVRAVYHDGWLRGAGFGYGITQF